MSALAMREDLVDFLVEALSLVAPTELLSVGVKEAGIWLVLLAEGDWEGVFLPEERLLPIGPSSSYCSGE